MASQQQVRTYLTYWFQLGKKVLLRNGQEVLLPQPVLQGDRYSDAFEECWQRILEPSSGECYLEGTHQTIGELLTDYWEIVGCARCSMPFPMPNRGLPSPACPCSDLPWWPNNELPAPRSPVDSKAHLQALRDRLQ